MKLVEAVKSLSSYKENWVIWELMFSKMLGLIFLILLRRICFSVCALLLLKCACCCLIRGWWKDGVQPLPEISAFIYGIKSKNVCHNPWSKEIVDDLITLSHDYINGLWENSSSQATSINFICHGMSSLEGSILHNSIEEGFEFPKFGTWFVHYGCYCETMC